ncbi:unnamed protein product [Protopolystoma xenopodis]|uniref:Uncharacterized protein n=1 Tax=Protopolystoma xenopodis TaxID=117903 RepID=A0A3S5B3S7_9PLAT|nr:unnamed protein product [Protopolystoma xenopodis]
MHVVAANLCKFLFPLCAQNSTSRLIERRIETWGDYNCLELAANANARKFLSSVACQNSLDFTWSNGVHAHPGWVALAIILPFCLLSKRIFKFQLIEQPSKPSQQLARFTPG